MEMANNQHGSASDQVEENRKKVADSKCEIDRMRMERDGKLKEMNFLKSQMASLQVEFHRENELIIKLWKKKSL